MAASCEGFPGGRFRHSPVGAQIREPPERPKEPRLTGRQEGPIRVGPAY